MRHSESSQIQFRPSATRQTPGETMPKIPRPSAATSAPRQIDDEPVWAVRAHYAEQEAKVAAHDLAHEPDRPAPSRVPRVTKIAGGAVVTSGVPILAATVASLWEGQAPRTVAGTAARVSTQSPIFYAKLVELVRRGTGCLSRPSWNSGFSARRCLA
jgi:hypothetical protein